MPAPKLCGAPTPKGPCTMKKGHEASYHRHREYKRTYWRVRRYIEPRSVISSGDGRVPLQYAISNALLEHNKIIVEIEQSDDD